MNYRFKKNQRFVKAYLKKNAYFYIFKTYFEENWIFLFHILKMDIGQKLLIKIKRFIGK